MRNQMQEIFKHQKNLTPEAVYVISFLGANKDDILNCVLYKPTTEKVSAIAAGQYLTKSEPQINGTGHVVES